MITKFEIFEQNSIKKVFENEYDIYGELLDSIVCGKFAKFRRLIESKPKPNDININGKGELLFLATESQFIWMIEELTKLGADWLIKNSENNYFLDYLNEGHKMRLKKLFPKKYKEYLFRKSVDNYNL